VTVHSRLALILVSIVLSAAPALSATPFGTFLRPSNGAQVRFYDCGGKLCAKVVSVKDASKASQVGTVILSGAAKTGDNEWKGDLLDVDSGKTYAGIISLVGADGLILKGCAMGFLCQSETWRRVR
jgi:uncharacterized protein (DUF2147 family)